MPELTNTLAEYLLLIERERECRPAEGMLADEIVRLRQGLWDIYRVLGGDTDGDDTPRSLVSDIVPAVQLVATEVREELDRCWEDNCGCL